MCTCITRRQCLAKVICGLLAWNSQLHWKKCFFLLLLCENVCGFNNITTYYVKLKLQQIKPKKDQEEKEKNNLLASKAVMSFGHILHLSPHLPEIQCLINSICVPIFNSFFFLSSRRNKQVRVT